ncbi:MAG: universal stress protein [Pirellulales bacterium]|nr:universal stress protein [Pirellulales bacterium]
MSERKILFPTDFSTLSDAALEYAASLARERKARLLIVHVEEPAMAYGGGEMYYGVMYPDSQALKHMLDVVKPVDLDVPFEHWLVTGDPADEIVRLAEQEECELIVMATHGRTGIKHLLMGSVAEAVVRRAKCPVLTFKPSAAEASAKKK